MHVLIVPEILSDNSVAFNVVLSDGDQKIVFNAITQANAEELTSRLVRAVNQNTVNDINSF